MKFKIFRAGAFTESLVDAFCAEHIILKDKYLENGDIYFFYKGKDQIGRTVMDEIEQIDRAVSLAQQDAMAAELDMLDSEAELAKLEDETKGVTPNKKRKWDELQNAKRQVERQRAMLQDTIKSKSQTIAHLMSAHADLTKHASVKSKKAA
jgi:small-conductance mechanosensitive channel